MKTHQFKIIMAAVLLLPMIFSCNKEDNNVPATIAVESETDISETGFTINWTVSSSDIEKITIKLSKEKTINVDVKVIEVSNTSQTSQKIEGLFGATTYYYRIDVDLADNSSVESDVKSVTTSFETTSVNIITSDGIKLAGKLKYLSSNNGKKPGIIFMHELRALGNEWNDAKIVTQLIAKGYVCLILDFRGHFLSDYVPLPVEHSEVEAFIYEVSKDLIASVEFMKSHEKVDGQNLALVGGSLGGIMAIAGNGYEEVVASVSLSGSTLGMYSIFPSLKVKSAFFIAAENDITSQGVNFAIEAEGMYNGADEPKKLKIIPDSNEHGTILLTVPGLNEEIIEWIDARIYQD